VLGIGLNVDQAESELPPASATPPGSLFTADGVHRDRAPLLADLLGLLEGAYGRWLAEGLVAFGAELERRDALRGRELEIDGLRGIAAGIGAGGELVLDTSAGRRLVSSGEAVPVR
jgi:BirA family biotin operon repressor/biotin-[acetyl-CoA-carboxylase] ligase